MARIFDVIEAPDQGPTEMMNRVPRKRAAATFASARN